MKHILLARLTAIPVSFDMPTNLSPKKRIFSFLAVFAALVFTATVHAENSGEVIHPGAGSALRKAVLDGLRPSIEDDLKQKVIFVVGDIRVLSDWAYLQVTPVRPDSKPIDFSKTKYKEAMEGGMFDGATSGHCRRRDMPSPGGCASPAPSRRIRTWTSAAFGRLRAWAETSWDRYG